MVSILSLRHWLCLWCVVVGVSAISVPAVRADGLPIVFDVEQQPLVAATARIIEALKYVGAPLSDTEEKTLRAAMTNSDRIRAESSAD